MERTCRFTWSTTALPDRDLRREGYYLLRFGSLRRRVERRVDRGGRRRDLTNPAADLLALGRRHGKIAVLAVPCASVADLRLVHGFLVEPALRAGCTVLVQAERRLDDPDLDTLTDPGWRYPWTLERLRHLARRHAEPELVAVPDPVPRWRHWWRRLSRRGDTSSPIPTAPRLDPHQRAAVRAGDGVVQIIAPAGSGKTTVLVERVRELQRRGTPAERILCLSFNRDAKVEIATRLAAAGMAGVAVRSFHGLGRHLLQAEKRLRPTLGELPDADLEHLIAAHGLDLETTAAREMISGFKLATMVTPAQAAAAQDHDQDAVRLYTTYEDVLARTGRHDFDDLVAGAVRLLQDEAAVRRRWQERYDRVLVDEYQDIEPAQALLVGLLAAPQDSLFCVGDEDQCIYAWRRATVRRIIELDQVYPGLERHALARNYRCGRRIVTASRRLIQHNRERFRKPLQAGLSLRGEIKVTPCADREEGAALAAYLLADQRAVETAVLARTARLLTEVAAACSARGLAVDQLALATIHGSKGREWDRVIIYGADEGQAPHAQALLEGGEEDERRLFYVALTRARRQLEIICTQGRESRFLGEAGL